MTTPTQDYNGAGMLFALGARFTRLNPDGSLMVGPENAYVTDALIQLSVGLNFEDGEQILQRNGAGIVCLTFQAPDSLTGGSISSMRFCTPDPHVLQFLSGGSVITDGDRRGYQAPEVGSDPTPNGVAMEFLSRQIINGAPVGYWHWVMPRGFVRPSGEWQISGTDPTLPEFEGNLVQNGLFGFGPRNDFPYPSQRVWQYMQVDDPFVVSPPGFIEVQTPITVTSVAITPVAPTVASGGTVQLTATATYSDSSTADVTNSTSWVSSDPAAATVSSSGLLTGVAEGVSDITATFGGQSDIVEAVVDRGVIESIAVTPADPAIAIGATQQMTATATYTDTTTEDITATAVWVSSDPSVATIDATGLAEGVAAGTADLSASQDTVTGQTTATVA